MSTKINKKQIKHIASLAKLHLTSEEIDKFQAHLADIVEYFDKLNEVETEGVPPTSQVTGLKNKLRKDEIIHFLKQKNALKNAPSQKKGFFKTKLSVKKDEKSNKSDN